MDKDTPLSRNSHGLVWCNTSAYHISSISPTGSTIKPIDDLMHSLIQITQGLLSKTKDNKGKIILEMSPQSIEIRDTNGKTAFHHAKMSLAFLKKCRTGNLRMDLLINQADNDRNTPLHVALINSEPWLAMQLLRFSGCNWRLRNKEGSNPLDLCNSNDNILIESPVYSLLNDLDHQGIKQRLGTWKWRLYQFIPSARGLYSVNLEEIDENVLRQWIDKIAIAAALLLTINFSSSFNVPGGYDNTGHPNLRKTTSFSLFRMTSFTAFVANGSILIFSTLRFHKRGSTKHPFNTNLS